MMLSASTLANWTTRSRPERRPLHGRYVRLEPLDPIRHGPDLFAAGSGPEASGLWRYLPEPPFYDRNDFEEWLNKVSRSEDPLFFAAVDQITHRAEGRIALMRIDAANGVIETGNILFGPRLARTRAATEAIYLVGCYVFDELKYRRLEWKCNDLNEPSKRAALRLGFTFEGVFRQHMVVKGENRDTAWFSMLDCEWLLLKRSFERWLDTSNFDNAGQQLMHLRECI
jgi:RimJ/RimL family protein N-acetyltransferase